MGNFLTQAGSDFWDILRKKLPESFGMQWGVPDTAKNLAVDTAKALPAAGFNPVNAVGMAQLGETARKGLNAYADLPTASNESISRAIQGQMARSGLGPNVDVAKWDQENPSPNIENRSVANLQPINPGVQARASLTPPPVAPIAPAITPRTANIPTTEEAMGRLMKNNPNMAVSYNGQSVNRPGLNQGGAGELEQSPTSAGTMTSIDPTTGKEKLVASFSPTKVRQWFETRPYGPGESPEERDANQKRRDWATKVLSNTSFLTPSSPNDKELASKILDNMASNATTARGQDIGAQSHRESLGPAWAREQLNAQKAPGEMALTAANARKLLEPSTIQTVQGFSGSEHITMERNRDTGKWDTVTKGEGPRTNQEEGSLLKTQQNLIQEQYKSDLETVSGKNIMATPEEKKAAQDRINSVKSAVGGQRGTGQPKLNPGERIVSKNNKRVVVNKNNMIIRELD